MVRIPGPPLDMTDGGRCIVGGNRLDRVSAIPANLGEEV